MERYDPARDLILYTKEQLTGFEMSRFENERRLLEAIVAGVFVEFVIAPVEDFAGGKILAGLCKLGKPCRVVEKLYDAGGQLVNHVGRKVPNSKALVPEYPPNRGFTGNSSEQVLAPGTLVDRSGYDGGTFVSPQGTPVPMRALKPGTDGKPYSVFEVRKPLAVQGGRTAPYYGQPGLGTQYELPNSIGELLDSGVLKRVGE